VKSTREKYEIKNYEKNIAFFIGYFIAKLSIKKYSFYLSERIYKNAPNKSVFLHRML
jgi:hypothetical protein